MELPPKANDLPQGVIKVDTYERYLEYLKWYFREKRGQLKRKDTGEVNDPKASLD